MLSIFSCICWPSGCLLWKNVCSCLLPIFTWIICFFDVELYKLFIYFYCGVVPKFIFAFVSLASGDASRRTLLPPVSEKLLPVSSSRILMDSCLIFTSFNHFDFIFVYGVREWSNLILLHVADQFSQYHLLKRLSSFHWMLFSALSKIS